MLDALQEFLTGTLGDLQKLEQDVKALGEHPDGNRKTLSGMLSILVAIRDPASSWGFSTLEAISDAGSQLLQSCLRENAPLENYSIQLFQEMLEALRAQVELIISSGADGGDMIAFLGKLEQSRISLDTAALDCQTEAATEVVAEAGLATSVEPSPETRSDAGLEGAGVCEQPHVVELDDEMKEVLKDFLQESYENLDRVDSELIELEEQPENRELLSSIFRSIHTIKGTCGFFGFDKLENVTHVGESLLVKLRDGQFSVTEEVANSLLALVDAVRELLKSISEHGHDGVNYYTSLVRQLSELKEHGEILTLSAEQSPRSHSTAGLDQVQTGSSSELPGNDVLTVGTQKGATAPATTTAHAKDSAFTDPHLSDVEHVFARAPGNFAETAFEASIRVDVPVLDALMNLVGELVLARNQIVEYVGAHENSQVSAAAQRLNLITSELQEGVMRTRMQPIHSIWAKLPRIVRDLSRLCGKQVRVEMVGKSTELDKSLIEAMKDPITHLIRNSIDHGLETPEMRLAAGKPAEGLLLLRAFHEGGQVHIQISDDGAGIDPERIRSKVIENGLLSREQAEAMSDQEVCKQIFRAGFSTAEKVTNISGRGVGMDVVKTNIERISGAIELDSQPGRGTIFNIRVPLTLTIVPALIVSVGSQRFAIPQINLIELLRIDVDDQKKAIEFIHGCPVYRLRGQLLSLVYLHEELKLQKPEVPLALNIVVLQADKCRYGLVVDQINDTQEIVVKPLTDVLKSIPVFSGATIMGDGRVALILDVLGMAQRAGIFNENLEKAEAQTPISEQKDMPKKEALLLVSTLGNGRMAIPLREVARLEQFDVAQTETVGDLRVMQYRGQIMPLINLSDLLPERRFVAESDSGEKNQIQVVVFGADGLQVGLIVEDIIDVVDEALKVRGKSSRAGVLGTAAIQGHVTELFDVASFMDANSARLLELGEAA